MHCGGLEGAALPQVVILAKTGLWPMLSDPRMVGEATLIAIGAILISVVVARRWLPESRLFRHVLLQPPTAEEPDVADPLEGLVGLEGGAWTERMMTLAAGVRRTREAPTDPPSLDALRAELSLVGDSVANEIGSLLTEPSTSRSKIRMAALVPGTVESAGR